MNGFITIGQDQGQNVQIKTVEYKAKKLTIKNTHQTILSSCSAAEISSDGQTLALGSSDGRFQVFRVTKFKALFDGYLRFQNKELPITAVNFLYLDNDQTLKPSIFPKPNFYLRAVMVSGGQDEAFQCQVHLFNTNSGESQQLNLSDIFGISPLRAGLVTCAQNRLIYAPQQRCHPG